MTDIDYTTAKRILLKSALSKEPGFTYERPDDSNSCLYTHRDEEGVITKGCIVGDGLISEGIVDMDFFVDEYTNTSSSYNVISILRGKGHNITQKADEFFRAVQYKQDDNHPWDRAVLQAIYDFEFGNLKNEYEDTLTVSGE